MLSEYRISPRVALLMLLVLAWLVVDAAVVTVHGAIIRSNQRMADWMPAVIMGLMFGQFAALAGWLALGDGAWLRRLTLGVVVVLGLLAAVRASDASFPLGDFIILSAIQVVAVFLPLLVTRLSGVRLVAADHVAAPARRWQFTLSEILGLMTLAAAVMAYLHYVGWKEAQLRVWHMVVLAFGFSAVGWVAWPVVFRLHPVAAAAALLVVATAFIGGIVSASLHFFRLGAVGMIALQMLTLAGSLFVLRAAGYQLRREPPI